MTGILRLHQKNIYIWLGAITLLIILYLGFADPFAIVMAYFVESIVIGLINFLKMWLTTKGSNKKNKSSTLFKCLFFLFHYSFFIFVQSIFVFAMFSISDNNIKEPFNVIHNYSYAFTMQGFGISMLVMVIVLLLETFTSYIQPKLYRTLSAEDLFFKPYIRVIIQQFTVLLAMFLVMITGLEVLVATILIALRLLVDLTGVYITLNDDNLRRVARFVKKDHTRSDIKVMEELKKYL